MLKNEEAPLRTCTFHYRVAVPVTAVFLAWNSGVQRVSEAFMEKYCSLFNVSLVRVQTQKIYFFYNGNSIKKVSLTIFQQQSLEETRGFTSLDWIW